MKKQILTLLLLSGFIFQSTNPMAGNFNRFATVVSVGSFLLPSLGFRLHSILETSKMDKDDRRFKKADEITDTFVRNTLRQADYPEDMIKKIEIKLGHWYQPPYFATTNSIYVPYNLKKYFKNPEDPQLVGGENPDGFLERAKGSLIHEASHIYNNHYQKRIFARLALPFLIQGTSFAAEKIIMSMVSRPLSIAQVLGKFAMIPINYLGLIGATCLFARSHEKEADFEVIKRTNDPTVLRTLEKEFKEAFDYGKKNAEKNYGAWINRYPNLAMLLLDPMHPNPLTRAEYFKKAAEELEKKQQERK